MKTAVEKALSKYMKVKDIKVLNKILWTIKGRTDCYTGIGLSRHEYEKFGTTERKLRAILDTFREVGLLELIERRAISGKKIPCCVFVPTEKLYTILDMLKGGIDNLSEKIISAYKNVNLEQVFQLFSIPYSRITRKLMDSKGRKNWHSSISYSNKLKVITDWVEGKTYNIYNYLKFVVGHPTDELNEFFNIA